MAPPNLGFPITMNGLLVVWQILGAPLVAIVLFYARDTSRQLRTMNGRLKVVETWMAEHEKFDNKRFDTTQRELDQIQRRCEQALIGRDPHQSGRGSE